MIGIIEHDRHRLTAPQHVIASLGAPLPGKQAVPEPEGIDPQMTRGNRLGVRDLDVTMGRFGRGWRLCHRHAIRASMTVPADAFSISTTQRSGSRRRWRSI